MFLATHLTTELTRNQFTLKTKDPHYIICADLLVPQNIASNKRGAFTQLFSILTY